MTGSIPADHSTAGPASTEKTATDNFASATAGKNETGKTSSPTMKDVAKEAGVSLGTVSKVVNGITVGKDYQKKVDDAIHKLNYRVNSYAQGLKSSRTQTVAFLVPDTINPFFGTLTFHINRALAKNGYRMLLCSTLASPEMEQSLLDMAEQNRVDGIICLSYNEKLQIKDSTRLVTIDRHSGVFAPCVASDNLAGGQLAVQKLAEFGCRHLLHMSISSVLPNEVTKRRDGFISACVSMGLEYQMLCLTDGSPFSMFYDYLAKHIAKGKPDFDGIFCGTDTLARMIIAKLNEWGIRVPEDVQVIGFNGIPDYATGQYQCSTIVQPVEQIAQTSVNLVLGADLSKAPPLVCLPVSYAYGGTTLR
ncbi:MAG: LacI family DNA-binding transcriptional regulator [Lachnospiraceae bacterium]|nr:LacI family DNA-binding transcriptional regulator [Lachnospiraceae bacterium]